MIASPLHLPSGATIRNRIVKSAMSEALGDEINNPTPALISLYERFGAGGAGLLITGNTPVDRRHLEHAANVVLDDQTDLAAMTRLAAAAKRGGALALAQIAHAGRQTPGAVNPAPLSISDVPLDLPGYGAPVAATEAELEAVIAKFADAAMLARRCGFDGVEVHAAHGYLLSSSLSPRINTRADRWGGGLDNRARLTRMVVRAVRAALGPDGVLAVKLNSADFQKGGFSAEDSVVVAEILEADGADLIEVSGGTFETPVSYQYSAKSEATKAREGYFLSYAQAVKAAVSIPVMVTGGFRSRDVMDAALSSGATDLIGMGRPFITDPGAARALLTGQTGAAPAVERGFPPPTDLPPGAALNWFCDQLMLQGTHGAADPDLPVIVGHQRYLARIETATARLPDARRTAAAAAWLPRTPRRD
ncbi:MAG: oxidoreductase [Pseudomonadota bacterium]